MFYRMPIVKWVWLWGGLVTLLCSASTADAAAELELYGTFHAMGVIITLDASDDPDEDAEVTVEYRTGSEAYQTGFPPSRITTGRFVGSLFWLDPGVIYDVRVSISDPDGGPIHGVVLQQSMTTRQEISIPDPTTTYYVHPDGTGDACTLDTPCSLSTGIGRAGAGETVVLRGGTYATGGLAMPSSGTESAPIVIQGYSGETAVLDGAYQSTFVWEEDNNGVYQTTVSETGIHLVMADGKRLFPYTSKDHLNALHWDNTPGFFQDGTTLYVHLENTKNPNNATMVISRHEIAFTVERDYIYFLDLTFKHFGRGAYPKAIYMNNASNNLVQGCAFVDNDLGVGLKRDSHRNVIQDNVFSDTIFDWPWAGVKDVGRLEDGGVAFYDPVTGRGNVIRRNTFHDDFDAMGVCPSTTAALTNETDIYDNVVFRMGDDGMETDGQCSNVRIWGNTFHDVLIGISLAPVYDGPVYAIRNLIYRTGVGNNTYPGSPFKFNSDYALSGPMYLFHNTSDAVLPGNNGLHIKAPGSWRMIYARNNIWAGTENAINNYNTAHPVDLDYDNLYNAGLDDLAYWDNTSYATLELFREVSQEANGLNVEPGFIEADSGLYQLTADSDLINAGIYIPGINHDYYGSAPDIGAFEMGTGNHTPVANNDVAVTAQDTAVTIEVMTNDRDADGDTLSIEAHSLTSANGFSVVLANGSSFLYTPAAGFNGADTFTYTITDGQAVSNTATVSITVQGDDTGPDDNPDSGNGGGGGSSGGGCMIHTMASPAK